jgi:uncharacterized protein (DUF849 family)
MSPAYDEFRNPPDGVRRLAARMQELGVRPELEIYDTGEDRLPCRIVGGLAEERIGGVEALEVGRDEQQVELRVVRDAATAPDPAAALLGRGRPPTSRRRRPARPKS